jgi:hypothetical protein
MEIYYFVPFTGRTIQVGAQYGKWIKREILLKSGILPIPTMNISGLPEYLWKITKYLFSVKVIII